MNRPEMLQRVRQRESEWDFIIIGGGATGVGCAVDAAARGYEVLLLEQSDFGKGTSSRSTKLVHGGVRYLEQGNISLVMEALKERGILRQNAPHLVKDLAFIVPNYEWWETPFYGIGLKIYNLLSGKYGFGKSKILSKKETLNLLPTIKQEGLKSGVIYYDGQFDDARLLINLVTTAAEQGATVLNYTRVFGLVKDSENFVGGVNFIDEESGELFQARAKAIINAGGAFCDSVRKMSDENSKPLIAASQGVHIVLDKSFLPTENAIMIPHTSDGRVMFAIPWHNSTLVGTTDTPIEKIELEPKALEEEIDFLLSTARQYLHKPPTHEDVLSVFTGIRPLVKTGDTKNTAALSRDHTIEIDASGLLTITGGKWTTYRRMAEDAVNQAAILAKLSEKTCPTIDLKIHAFCENAEKYGDLSVYGADAEKILQLTKSDSSFGKKLHPKLPYAKAEIVWAARNEMARTVEDALARRTRALFLNARAAIEIAPMVAEIMAQELNKDPKWEGEQVINFNNVAENYLIASRTNL
jgi:glycerol-3-phosphate dehydrogenase